MARSHQGKGYATEAVTMLLDYLFIEHNLHRVSANCDQANIASAKLLEQVGIRRKGHFHKSLWFKGDSVDELWFTILRDEWH
ncbi:MAG: GNAT family protein [Nostoc sp.]|uniref:GNAT family N-acetyltransferase n=1 Tax=Nostoc sp. TaxID=1180 RepID=UPI002FF657BC